MASYFRKADGVVLLYDCCSERSFVSIRDWVSSIRQHGQAEELPIIICANKIDAREERIQSGMKVSTGLSGSSLTL